MATQPAGPLYTAVPIAVEEVNLDQWSEFVASQSVANITPLFTEHSNREQVYRAVTEGDILVLLHAGAEGREGNYARRLIKALAELRDVHAPAVLFVQAAPDVSPTGALATLNPPGLRGVITEVRHDFFGMIEALQSGQVTPLWRFAPQLREAILGPAGEGPSAGEDEASPADFTFEDFRQEQFSALAWQMLEMARRLGERRPRPQTSVRRLLAAIILSGLRRKGDEATGAWLCSLIPLPASDLRSRIQARYPAATRHKGSFDAILRSDLFVSQHMTETLHTLLQTAKHLAAEARPGMPVMVCARHLLGAAVCLNEHGTTLRRALRDYQLDVDDVRHRLIDVLPVWGLDDDQDAWRRVLEPVAVTVEPRLPNYAADSAVGPDLIGITREVEAMASLVSAWSVEPPLSIGLFGEWGSGKSFFMQKMKERVKQIAVEARKSKRAQRDFGYYKNIVQVEFNAWHYVEGNLWASLVEHIFTNLRFEGTKDENLDSEDNIKKRLEKMLGLLRDRTADADAKDRKANEQEEKARTAAREASEAVTRANTAKENADTAERASATAMQEAVEKEAKAQNASEIRRAILLKDAVEDVSISPEARAELESGLARLGIGKERLQTVQGVRDALKEATDTGTVLAEGLDLLRQNGGVLLLLWALAVPLAVIVVGFLFDYFSSVSWVQRLGSTVSTVLALAGAAVASWKTLAPQLQPLVDLVKRMKAKRIEVEIQVEEERRKRATQAAEAEREVIAKQAEAAQQRAISAAKAAEALELRQKAENERTAADKAANEAAEARALAESTAREADALRPERRIATFIQDRAAATDYRQHLGVPALIRRDFEKLSSMFETQRQSEENGADGGQEPQQNDPTVVNRIILYIDDLDRCPPQKVVDVLRAIHLLLAFRLFVVVVAVDARWMKRSLKDRFSLMLDTADSGAFGAAREGREHDGRRDHIGWRATASPDDYLEKIFQVPFWIRPLGRSGSQRLVRELTRHDVETGQDASGGALDAGDSTSHGGDANRTPGNILAPPVGAGRAAPAPPAIAAPASKPTLDVVPASKAASEWSPVAPKPRTLMLTAQERDYMVLLSPLIGRSPRSVKRFVNCYRLLKSTLDPADLERATRSGGFRTSMLLLGIVTGFPEAAPALLKDLRDASRDQAPEAWARDVAKRLQLEERGKWAELLPAISRLREWNVHTVGPLIDAAPLVDRFSFSPVQRPVEELV